MKKIFLLLLIFMIQNQLCATDDVLSSASPKPIKVLPRDLVDICFVTSGSSSLTVRPFQDSDITEDFIGKQCTYDPTDPMDKPGNYVGDLPTIDEVQAGYRERYAAAELGSIPFGIFRDAECVGLVSLTVARGFYNAVEVTTKIFSEFRGRGFAPLALSGLLNDLKRRVQEHPEWGVFFVEGVINSSNAASIAMSKKIGMQVFDDSGGVGYYYYPLIEGDLRPQLMPQVEDPE